jgi:GT2 family glycosyltransferase
MHFKHAFAIPTRNRPREILDVLYSLSELTGAKNIDIAIAENSDSDDNYMSLQLLLKKFESSFNRIILIRSSVGSSVARNTLIDELTTDLITFIDDDIELPRDYAISMDKLFFEVPDLVGSSPFIVTFQEKEIASQPFSKKTSRFRPPGRISEWGINTWFEQKPTANMSVNWLPGCAMTVRLSSIGQIRFDENLQNGPAKGYALGEDVDFSYRLGQTGLMLVNSDLQIIHKLSENNRKSNSILARAQGYFDFHLVKALKFDFRRILYINVKVLIYSIYSRNLEHIAFSGLRVLSLCKCLVQNWLRGFLKSHRI